MRRGGVWLNFTRPSSLHAWKLDSPRGGKPRAAQSPRQDRRGQRRSVPGPQVSLCPGALPHRCHAGRIFSSSLQPSEVWLKPYLEFYHPSLRSAMPVLNANIRVLNSHVDSPKVYNLYFVAAARWSLQLARRDTHKQDLGRLKKEPFIYNPSHDMNVPGVS